MRWGGKGHRRKSVSQFYQVGCYTLYIIHNSLSNLYSLAIPFITLIARSFLQGIDWLPHPYLYHMCVAIWFWTQPCLSLCVHILVHIHHIRILFQLDINYICSKLTSNWIRRIFWNIVRCCPSSICIFRCKVMSIWR